VKKVILPAKNTVLVLPDSHAHPDFDNNRYTALSNWIEEHKPTAIVNLGDLADMPSLCSYDKGKKSFEGKRFVKDIEATIDAQEKLFAFRKSGHDPMTVHVMGNHCDGRIRRVVDLSPEYEGLVSLDKLQYDKYWKVNVPFMDKAIINGAIASHYFVSGLMGRPIGGKNAASSILDVNKMSSMCGHSHLYDYKEATRADGQKMFSLVGGCYVHPKMVSDWNAATACLWDNSVTIITNLRDGYHDGIQKIPQSLLMKEYY